MKKFLLFLSVFLLVIGVTGNASADLLTNGGFETGDLTGWDHSINVNVQEEDVLGNIDPYEGNYMAVLATGIGALDAYLEQDFNADDYSSITVSFAYNLQAVDTNRIDFGIDDLTGSISAAFGSYELFSVSINDDPDGLTNSTVLGWTIYSYTFDLTSYQGQLGPITLSFDLENAFGGGEVTQFTAAYVDAVSVTGTSAPVPEPTTMLLLGTGLLGFAGFRRKFKK